MSIGSESPDPIARAQIIREELQRVMDSSTFRSSEVLRKLLSYLADAALKDRPQSIRAKDVAVAVFNRVEHFDSQSDSVVRVQMGRLRAKLAELYVDEIPETDWILTIPKGSYQLSCHSRRHVLAPFEHEGQTKRATRIQPATAGMPSVPSPARHSRIYPRLTVPAVAALLIFVCAFWAGRSVAARETTLPHGTALNKFWKPFAGGADPPLVVFSNQKLVGSVHGLHTYRGTDADRNLPLIQSWTTVGEVVGVYDVTKILALFRKTPIVKPAHLLTWDEAKNDNLIVVGGPLSETADITLFRDFQFENSAKDSAIPSETGAIANLRPVKGEEPLYIGPAARPFDFDYALISLHPSLSDGRVMLAMAGITEYGTEAAADFLTDENSVRKLLQKLDLRAGGSIPWFEALLRVKVQDGVPLQPTIVALRREST